MNFSSGVQADPVLLLERDKAHMQLQGCLIVDERFLETAHCNKVQGHGARGDKWWQWGNA